MAMAMVAAANRWLLNNREGRAWDTRAIAVMEIQPAAQRDDEPQPSVSNPRFEHGVPAALAGHTLPVDLMVARRALQLQWTDASTVGNL